MVAELCPDGVECVAVSDLFELRNGYTPSKSVSSYWEGGNIPWFRMEDIRNNGRVLKSSLKYIHHTALKKGGVFPENSIIVATSATIGEHALIKVPFLCNQRFTSLTVKSKYKNKVSVKFLFYYGFILDEWCKNNTTKSIFASVDMKGFKSFTFPIPSLEVQNAIVDILDKFTKLEAELAARRAQYEYYRNSLFENLNGGGAEILGNLVRIKNGKSYKGFNSGDVPVYGSGGIMTYIDHSAYDGSSVLIPRKGSLGNIFYTDTPFWNVDTIFYTEIDQSKIVPKYLYYALHVQNLSELNTAGGVPSLTQTVLKRVRIPLPPLAEQERIVSILDTFDVLVNDISSGLPAELEARRKAVRILPRPPPHLSP